MGGAFVSAHCFSFSILIHSRELFRALVIFFFFPFSSNVDRFTRSCCWKEDGSTFSRAEGCGGVLESVGEAGDVFYASVRSILEMKHLWDEREVFRKF